jgi:hypothetical protein
MTTVEKRIAALLSGNSFAASGGSRLPVHPPRETRPCTRCGLLTDVRSLTSEPNGEEICPVCYDLAGALSDYDRECFERLVSDAFCESHREKRRRAGWDKWAHRLTVGGFSLLVGLIALLVWENVRGGK